VSDFLMPALGADMEAGTLVEWLIKPGDKVKRGDVVAVVETQKGAIEIETFNEGIVSELVVPVGTKVPVGSLIARIGAPGEIALERPAAAAPPPPPQPWPASMPAAPPRPSRAGVRITPAARRRAAELGVDPLSLSGTGVDGAVSIADVEAAAARRPVAPSAPAPPPRRVGFNAAEMRKAIAAAMGRSKREIPHYYLSHSIDLGAALAWLTAFNDAQPVPNRLLPAVMLLKATALALREVPQLNGTYVDGQFQPGPGIHVGWAISLRGGGLVAPAVVDADTRPLTELMSVMRDLVQRARTGGLRSSELGSATVTITSLGDRSADMVLGIIYPPQVALIGFGGIATRPWVVDGRVEPRPLITVSLAGDHRASDGHVGGLLLNAIERLLQEPEKL
jgi:pyruvate dehydrogenase E2 component (dihydrolipoamide acetyltransferase)